MNAPDAEGSAARRLRDRWRQREAPPQDAPAETVVPFTSPQAPSSETAPETTPEPPRPAKAGPGFREFVLHNARLLAAILLLAIGVALVILGWYGAAYTNVLTEQIPYLISGGLLGAALIIVAGFLASSVSLERENRALRRDLVRALSSMGGASSFGGFEDDGSAPASDGKVLVVAGGRSYHLPGCPIVEGKSANAMTVREATKAGLGTCKLCGPD